MPLDFRHMSVEDTLAALGVKAESGLSSDQVQRIRDQHRPKVDRAERWGPYGSRAPSPEPKCTRFLGFLWGPLVWTMECAALVAIVLCNGPEPWLCYPYGAPECSANAAPDWEEFVGIICLLLVYCAIHYCAQDRADAAIEAALDQMARKYHVKRDGAWMTIPLSEFVRGDIVLLSVGDVIVADCKVIHGEPALIDQAALTGASLPVRRGPGEDVYMGSSLLEGEVEAVITSTGVSTILGNVSARAWV